MMVVTLQKILHYSVTNDHYMYFHNPHKSIIFLFIFTSFYIGTAMKYSLITEPRASSDLCLFQDRWHWSLVWKTEWCRTGWICRKWGCGSTVTFSASKYSVSMRVFFFLHYHAIVWDTSFPSCGYFCNISLVFSNNLVMFCPLAQKYARQSFYCQRKCS